MPTSYTSLLGLALPVTGELSGVWGDTVNDYITQYLDGAVAGTQTISGSQTAVTLSKTTAASLTQVGSGATGSSQYSIINCTGNPAGLLTITAPAASKPYIIINATSTAQSVKIVGAGPTTGVTLVSGEKAVVAWNGSDFTKIATSTADGVTTIDFGTTGLTPSTATSGAVTVAGTLAATNGGTGQSSYAVGDLLYASTTTALAKLADVATGNALISGGVGVAPSYGKIGLTTHVSGTLPVANGGTGLSSGTSGGVLYYSATGTLASSAALASNALVVGGGAGVAPSTITTGTGVVTALGVNTGTAGAFVVNGGALGTPSSGTVTNLTGTASININGTVGATTPNTGAFTSVTSTSASGILTRAAATQDGVELVGRAGGTTSLKVTLTPTTLTASRTVTLPDADINFTTGLGVAQGGTGTTSLTANNVILGNGTSAVQFVAPGTNGNVLTSNGTTWVSQAAGVSLTGVTQSVSPFETALGADAGLNTTGANNTLIGYYAGRANTTGTDNTAVGFRALDVSTIGVSNTALGSNALGANTTGNYNSAVGDSALVLVTTGEQNTALGWLAGSSVATGSYTTAVGARALASNTGGDNTAVGALALFSNTTGVRNTAVGGGTSGINGRGALGTNTVGTDNTAMGFAALSANSTGSSNTAVGSNALLANTTGTDNTAVGYAALDANTTGQSNTALGSSALGANTTASSNTAIGNSALRDNTTGASNTAIGQGAMLLNSTGNFNVASGLSALRSNTTGGENAAFGFSALYGNTTADFNSAFGANALYANTTGANNTAVGYTAGDKVTTGTQNTILGSSAASSGTNDLTTGSNNTIIGYNAAASSATVSNEVTIGNASVTSFRIPGLSVTWGANTVPYRNVPPVGTKTGSYTLAVADVGKYVQVGSGGSITIPDATFAEGDVVSVFNNTTGNITITCTITTAYIAGTDSDKASVTLATRGVATILFISSTICVISGNVS